MAQLALTCLGEFQVTLNGQPLHTLHTAKVRALLVYLAVEGEVHSRSTLARLLWPGYSAESARNNLRQAVFELRQALGDASRDLPFLLSSRLTLQLNPNATVAVDVQRFTGLVAACEACLHRLQAATDLYRGDFLAGFTVDDSTEFEEWRRLMQEQLHLQALDLLTDLADAAESIGDDEQAETFANRQLGLEPWLETAHRQLMRIFARRGQRSAATAQYQHCRQVLATELGAEPEPATTTLYEAIRSGAFAAKQSGSQTDQQDARADEETGKQEAGRASKPRLSPSLPLSLSPASPFVAREHELERLQDFLARALAGQGQLVFVSGEAGSGKTTLVQTFAQQAQAIHAALIVAGGICNAQTGAGDPYLPFRGLVNLLTGGLEGGGREGLFAEEQARRLFDFMPTVVPILVESAAEVIDSFVPAAALWARVETFADSQAHWVRKLAAQVERAGGTSFDQHHLFTQLTALLQRLAGERPLLLFLDDLHWADPSSLNLLFHLGRSLSHSRILLVGAYRPEEVTVSAEEKPPSLLTLLNEFKRIFGDIGVDLDSTVGAKGRHFVDALVDSQLNHLGETFRQALFQHTEGHALFTVELLRHLQSQGLLVQDAAGNWIEPATLDWASFPARVEGVIEQRIGRLTPALRQILQVASVEGEEFTAEVVAHVQRMGERELVRQLGEALDRRHRLVSVQGLTWVGAQRLSRYTFRHNLYQKYLYQSLDEVERSYLHADMVTALETLYAEQIESVVVQLARHCQAAGLTAKAVDYFRLAGEHAQRLAAYPEAISHFRQGLALLATLPNTPARAQRELTLQLALINVLIVVKSYGAPEVGTALQQALALSRHLGDTREPFWLLHGLHRFSLASGEWQIARDWAEQLVAAVQTDAEPALRAEAYRSLGLTQFYLGEFALALAQFEQGLAHYQRQPDFPYWQNFGQHTGQVCSIYVAMSLWLLGYADQAERRIQEALVLAEKLAHPFALTLAQTMAGYFFYLTGNVAGVRAHCEIGFRYATHQRLEYWNGTLLMAHGWALAMDGEGETGVAEIRQGLTVWLATGAELVRHAYLAMLAEAIGKAGQPTEALHVLDEALAAVPSSGQFLEAELYRLQGELLLAENPNQAAAAACAFVRAIAIAQQQGAKSLELRATLSLSRLRQEQGKIREARQHILAIYNWFSEGLDQPNLQVAAKALAALTEQIKELPGSTPIAK